MGVSGLADWIQEDLFGDADEDAQEEPAETACASTSSVSPVAADGHPGMDVVHDEHGQGWVWGAGVGRVTVRFETAETGPGRVRTFTADDPALQALRPPAAEGAVDSDAGTLSPGATGT